jgi:DNA polymerase III delta prime subunit
MKIERTELIRKLKEYVIKDSGVIIGPPGVGKTYTISELIKDLSDYNVLFLPIEQLGDGSEEDLRSILEYEGNFVEWIKKGVSGLDKKCIIIFDAYDSARDEVKRSNFLRIISQIKRELSDYINVIVTVRTFDAKKSAELINLFQTNKNENNIVGEIDCRYFLIPPLQDEEIEQAKIQIPFLDEILLNSTKELNDILRIPFNLWLLEKILSSFQNITEFTPIRSEVQLLNLFWKKRVTDHKNSMLREFVLNKVATRMVETKSLTSRISEVIEPAIVPTFEELLSDEILKRVLLNGQRISFSHNILFDSGKLVGKVFKIIDNANLDPTVSYHFFVLPRLFRIHSISLRAMRPKLLIALLLFPAKAPSRREFAMNPNSQIIFSSINSVILFNI